MRLQPPDRPEPEELRDLKLICMRNLLSATEERVYFKDLMSRFLFVSEGWIAAYAPGRSAEELMGKTDFDVFSSQHAAVGVRRRAADHPHRRADRRAGGTGDLQRPDGRLGVHHQDAAAGRRTARSSARSAYPAT